MQQHRDRAALPNVIARGRSRPRASGISRLSLTHLFALFILFAGVVHNFEHYSDHLETAAHAGTPITVAPIPSKTTIPSWQVEPASDPEELAVHEATCILARMVLVPLEHRADLPPPSTPIQSRQETPLAPLFSNVIAGFQSRAPPFLS